MRAGKNRTKKSPDNKKGRERWKKIRTTHIAPGKNSVPIAAPIIINGVRCLAYVKEERIVSYITLEEVMKIIMKDNIPKIKANF